METAQDDHVITLSCATEYPCYEAEEKGKCWGLVTLKASRYEPEESKRAALDIVAVIDKSGSMRGEKLFLVKKSLEFLVQNLLEKDRLCVITYDTNVYVNFELLAMNSKNKEFVRQKIQEIESGTSTNLCGGLLQGLCQILDRNENKNDVASVLLFTDGLANQGITQKSMIIRAMKNPRKYLDGRDNTCYNKANALQRYQSRATEPLEPLLCGDNVFSEEALPQQNMTASLSPTPPLQQQQPVQQSAVSLESGPSMSSRFFGWMFNRSKPVAQPVSVVTQCSTNIKTDEIRMEEKDEVTVDITASVYTFGFGCDHDPELLKAISDAANGMYFYIENDEQISASFGHCFGGLVSTLGQSIKLNLELCDGVTVNVIHMDQNCTHDDDLCKWQVNLGDMQSDEQRDVLLTLNLPPARSSPNQSPLVKASITYFSVVDSVHKESQAEMAVQRSDKVHHSPDVANPAIDRQRNRIFATTAIKEALQMADEGKLDLARKRLSEEIKRVKKSLTGKDEFCKLLVKDMERSLSGLKDKVSYKALGKKSQINLLQMHSKQRSNRAETNSYSTCSNMLYQTKFK